MKKQLILFISAALGAATLNAHADDGQRAARVGDNWFIGAGVGVNATIAGGSFSSPGLALELNVGKWVSETVGVRASVHGLYNNTAADRWVFDEGRFVQLRADADVLWNVFNVFGSYKQDRFWNLSPFARVSLIASGKTKPSDLELGVGAGLHNDFRLSERVGLYLDIATAVSRERAYRNAGRLIAFPQVTAGISIRLGRQGFTRNLVEKVPYEVEVVKKEIVRDTVLVDKIVEKETVKEVVKEKVVKKPYIDVFFAIGSAHVDLVQQKALDRFAAGDAKGQRVMVVGSADRQTGSAEKNYELALERAKAVKDYLVQQCGVPADSVTVTANGDVDSVSDNPTEDRRVRIQVL